MAILDTAGKIKESYNRSPAAFGKYKSTISGNNSSTRSADRLAKVARTIADLSNPDLVEPHYAFLATKGSSVAIRLAGQPFP